jgi:hypothetical protein
MTVAAILALRWASYARQRRWMFADVTALVHIDYDEVEAEE